VLARFIRNGRLAGALHQQAQSALRASPGARAFYDEQRDRGLDHDAALRALSNRLVGILHGCLKPEPSGQNQGPGRRLLGPGAGHPL